MGRKFWLLVVFLLALSVSVAGVALAAPQTTAKQGSGIKKTEKLRKAVEPAGILVHERRFQKIATANDGNRASGTPGYDASAAYVADKLRGAGYKVTVQPFEFPFFQELEPTTFAQTAPTAKSYADGTDFAIMEYSGSGDVTADVQPVDVQIPPGAEANSSTSGCEAADFAGFTAGNVALIQRGTCTFAQKAENAEAAGASAVVIFNEGQAGRTDAVAGTLGGPGVTIPVIGASFAVGEELVGLARNGGATVRVFTSTLSENRQTANVIADTRTGNAARTVVVGSHLDSVPEGPGINDNGSGSATDLEIALQMAKVEKKPKNKVRFAFWGAEESGLLGAEFYVNSLSDAQFDEIALNLNFDMIGSPNYVRFVYDGDGSDTPDAGPAGSAEIESVFNDYFAAKGLATEPTAFDGRSDYGPFIANGIPAGGLFTGAEGIKTPEEAAIYGGTAGEAYDPCYHQACDDISNLSVKALNEMSDAAAHATLTFANAKTLFVPDDNARGFKVQSLGKAFEDYKGPDLKR